jgi:hypothetical protein
MTTVKFYIYTDDYSSYEAMTESVIERFKIEYPEAQSETDHDEDEELLSISITVDTDDIEDEGTENRTIQLCVDRRFGQEPAIWFGYPGSEGSERIEDETIIDYIIKKVAQHKERQAHKLDQFIEIRENIRNFRIDKTLEQ